MIKLKRTFDAFQSHHSNNSPLRSEYAAPVLLGSPHNQHHSLSNGSSDPLVFHDPAMDFMCEERPSKRQRHSSGMSDEEEDGTAHVSSSSSNTSSSSSNTSYHHGNNGHPQQQQHNQKNSRCSPFIRPEALGVESHSALLDRFMAFKTQRKSSNKFTSSPSSCKRPEFTEDEVKLLLSHREEQLRMEYDKILQEQLQEQFNQFTQFNQDYISSQYKPTDFSYIY